MRHMSLWFTGCPLPPNDLSATFHGWSDEDVHPDATVHKH